MSVFKSAIEQQLKSRKGGFFQVPNEIWDAKISGTARSVWMYILAQSPRWHSSIANIARNLNLSRGTVQTATRELADHSMLLVDNKSSGSDFTLTQSDSWNVEWQGQSLIKIQALAAQNESNHLLEKQSTPAQIKDSIQDFNTSNTLNTEVYGGEEIKNFEDDELIDFDEWKKLFLRNKTIRTVFLKLSETKQTILRNYFNNPQLVGQYSDKEIDTQLIDKIYELKNNRTLGSYHAPNLVQP